MTDSTSSAPPAAAAGDGLVARNALYLLIGQVASTALSIGLNAALGRKLGVAEFGVYYLLVSMATFGYVFVEWGQSAYLIREGARRPAAANALLTGAILFRVAAACAMALVIALLARLIGYDARTQRLAAWLVICSLPFALSQPFGYLFRSRDRMDLDAAVTITAKALLVGLTIPVLVLGGRLDAVVTVQAAGGLGALAVAVLLARRQGIAPAAPSREAFREVAWGGASIAVFFLAMAVQPYLDAIVLSQLAPAEAVGRYGAARNIMGVLLAPATILATAAFPQFSRAAGNLPELRAAIRAALRFLLGLGALGAVGTFLFADFAVTLVYGRGRFGPAAQVLELFAPVLFFYFIDIVLASVITATGKTRELAAAKLLSVALSTTAAILLIPFCQERYGNGGLGLVLAFGSTEVVMLAACAWLAPAGAFGRGTLLDLGRALLCGAGTLAVFHLLPGLTPWLGLPLSIAVFGGLALATGLFGRNDLATALALLRREFTGAAALLPTGSAPAAGAAAGAGGGPRPPPLVSIVINNFNYARFLADSIESALAQTHPRTEVVVVDDASTDGSRGIIAGYGDRVRAVLQERNGGQAAAMTAGFGASRGDIVIFLDADDYLYPHAAARVAAAWAPGTSKVQYRLDLVDACGGKIDVYPPPEWRFDSGDVVPQLLARGRYETTVTSGNAFAREALEQILPIPEADFRIAADGYLVTLAPFHGPVRSIEEPLGAYRQHGKNAWAMGSVDMRSAGLGERLRWLLAHDAQKSRALQAKARAVGLVASETAAMRDHQHIATRIASLCLDPERHPYAGDTRPALALRGALASREARTTWTWRLILATWFLAAGLLPRTLASRAISWRLLQVSRPHYVARVLKTIRRLAR